MSINEQVTREQYSDTLKSTVNGYYEHLLASGYSQQQAIERTMPVAEAYHNAMDEFDAAHQEATTASGTQPGQNGVSEETEQSAASGTGVTEDTSEDIDESDEEDLDDGMSL